MALNKVKIKNTESIRLVTGDKTEVSGGSSFNGIEVVGVTNGADAVQVTDKTSLTIHSRVPGISFSVATSGITAEIEAFPVANSDEEEIFSRIAGNNHLYFFTTVSGPTNIPNASSPGEFIFNADRREISINAVDLNNRTAGKQSFTSAAEIFNGVILASRTDTAGENVFEEHTITYNNPTFDGTKFDVDDVTITNGATLESWYGGTRPVLVSIIPDPALLGATEVAARTAFVFPDGCSAQSIVSSWNGLTCEVTFDQYVADINGLTGAIDTSGLTFNFAGLSASGDITTNKLIFGDGTTMSTAASVLGATGATGEQAIAKTYAVTVAEDPPSSGNNYYYIDTVKQETIHLLRGQKYVFSLAGSVSGHPFHLQTTSGSAYDSSNLYTTGVVNAGAESGDITFTVPYDAPSNLYYRCQYHANMGGVVTIKNLTANDLQGINGSDGGGITLAAGVGLALSSVVEGVGHTLDVTLSAGTGITLTGTTFNVDAVTSFNGASGDVTLTAGTGITLTGTELNVDAVTSFNGASGDVTLSAGTGITLTGTELNVDAVTSFNGASGDVTLSAGTGITLTGNVLSVDAVTSVNGASGDVTIAVGSGGGDLSFTGDVPAGASAGDLWFDSDVGVFSVYVDDGDSQQWVELAGKQGPTGATGQDGSGGGGGGTTLAAGSGMVLSSTVAGIGHTLGIDPTASIHVAGISSDGGITLGGEIRSSNGKFYNPAADTGIDVSNTSQVNILVGTSARWSVSSTKVSTPVRIVGENVIEARGIIEAEAGISLDVGITFADGTFQSTAASGSGSGGGLTGSLSYNGLLEFPTNKTYRLDRYTVEARTFNFLHVDCATGGCSADFYAAGSTLSNTLNVTPSGASASFATAVPAGSTFSLVVTGITSGNLIQDFGFVAGYTQ